MRSSRLILFVSFFFFVQLSIGQWNNIANDPIISNSGMGDKIQVLNVDTIVVNNIFGTTSGLFMSVDNGDNWNVIFENTNPLDFDFLNTNEGLVIRNDTLFNTVNSGVNWQGILEVDNLEMARYTLNNQTIYAFSSDRYSSFSQNEFYKTSDGGANWDTLSLPFDSIASLPLHLTDLIVVSEDSVICVANTFTTGGYTYLFESFDGGISWSATDINGGGYVSSNWFKYIENGSFFLLTGGTGILKTNNNGSSYTNIDFSPLFVADIDVIDDFVAVACTLSNNSTAVIARSSDLLGTWQFDNVNGYYPANMGVTRIDMLYENYGWASSWEGLYSFEGPPITSHSAIAICPGDSVLFAGNYRDTTGYYVDTINDYLTYSLSLFVRYADSSISVTNNTLYLVNNVLSSHSLEWLNCDSNYSVVPGENAMSFTPNEDGNYAIRITYGGLLECVTTSSCLEIQGIGINENIDSFVVNLHPNPTENSTLISFNKICERGGLKIYDVFGRIVKVIEFSNSQKIEIDLIAIPAGHYIIQLNLDGRLSTYNFVKN